MPRGDRAGWDKLLLGGRLFPITSTWAFFNDDVQACVDSFVAGRGRVIYERTGCRVTVRRIEGPTLEDILLQLLPLTSGITRKYLFLPTAAPEPWTAFVKNDWRGADVQGELIAFACRGVTGVSVSEFPNNYDRATNFGYWGQRKMEVAYPHGDFDYEGHSLGVRVNDSARWEMVGLGEPYPTPFPDPTDYTARRIPDRFTHEHLAQGAAHFGLRPFDEDFYAPQGWGILVEDPEPRQPHWDDDITLDQAQHNGKGHPRLGQWHGWQ